MRSIALLLVLAACAKRDTPPPEDGADPTPTPDDTAPVDTDVDFWDTGEIDGRPGVDTFDVTDDPIGATPLDGTWVGTFTFTQINPLGVDPRCAGTAIVTIDGQADRHLVARFTCRRWAPNIGGILGPYGPLTGIGFATLDPAALDRAFLDASFVAARMTGVDLERVRANVSDGVFTLEYDGVSGIGPLRAGTIVSVEATLGAALPDTAPPVDTADTDTDTDTDTDPVATGDTGTP